MAMTTDRRRINPPSGGTSAPLFAATVKDPTYLRSICPTRNRVPNELRKIFLQPGIIPSASGSAYLEIPSIPNLSNAKSTLLPSTSSLKVMASVQGPKPLSRTQPFSPTLLLTTTVKYAPFATRHRRGYIRDAIERDLGVHLETALRGVLIGERWPKSGLEVVVTVLEGEEDRLDGYHKSGGHSGGSSWGLLNVLASCITVAGAAIMDAGIDCVDMVTGGVAAIVRDHTSGKELQRVLDPCPADHQQIVAACAVGYLASRDEITELWLKGDAGSDPDSLIEGATQAASGTASVLKEVMLETLQAKLKNYSRSDARDKEQDVEMTG